MALKKCHLVFSGEERCLRYFFEEFLKGPQAFVIRTWSLLLTEEMLDSNRPGGNLERK